MKFLLSLLLFPPSALGVLNPRAETPCHYYRPDGELVEDEYIVALHSGHTLQDHFEQIGTDLTVNASMFHRIDAINGYRARLPQDLVHDHIRFDAGVEFVEHDQIVEPVEPVDGGETSSSFDEQTREEPSLLRRLLNRARNFRRDNWWHWQISYRSGAWYDVHKSFGKKHKSMWWWTKQKWQVLDGAGKGVRIYILDTGIKLDHKDLQGRAVNFKGKDTSPYVGDVTAKDKDGHGTHIAGTAAGARGGMAPWATLVNVKVVCRMKKSTGGKCNASSGGIAQAISDITEEHKSYKKGNTQDVPGWKGSVINMSLTTGHSDAMRRAMKGAFDEGVAIAVAAGNEAKNTASVFPCLYTESTVCVASSDIDYKLSPFSNYGRQVKMIAPGSEISSADFKSDTAYTWMSGTSMASPFVAGAMAIFISFEAIDNDVKKVWDRLVKNQIVGLISNIPSDSGTPNNFVNSGINSVLKNSHEPYYGALSIDRPASVKGQVKAAAEDEPEGAKDWEEDPDPGPGFKTIGVNDTDPSAVVIVTEEYAGPVETNGPNPDEEEDVGFEGDNSMDEPETLDCAPTDTNGPVLARGNIEGSINDWCDSLDQGTVDQDDTRKEEVKHFGSSEPGTKLTDLVFSANWVEEVVGDDCPQETRGTEPEECKKAMYDALDLCGGKDGMESGDPRYGGSQLSEAQCVKYQIEILDMGLQERRRR